MRNRNWFFFAPQDDSGAASQPPAPGAPAPAAVSPPAAESAAPAPAAEPGQNVKDLLNYDPFEPPAQPSEPGTPPVPGQAPTQTAEQQLAAAQPPAPPANPELDTLRQELAELRAVMGAQAPAQSQQPDPNAAPAQPERNYNFQIPAPIFEQLNSEDPAQRNQGLVTVVNGVAEIIHSTVLQKVQAAMAQLVEQIPHVAQTNAQQVNERTQAFNDFYGVYKDLNNPELMPLVAQVGQRVAKTMNAKAWTPELRDAIGREVYKLLGRQVPSAVPARPQPAAQASPSARLGAPAMLDDQQKEMMELFS